MFLARYWQKSPLLIRGGLAASKDIVELRDLIELACHDDCQSRLILRQGSKWRVEHGPFVQSRFRHLRHSGWTLLVQGVEQFVPAGRDLLDKFNFISHARLDDLMVSYAPSGAGVGPHFDHYDVFLLQGQGRRLWRVSHQQDLELIPDLPLKILQRFQPQGECVLEEGDLLYLPPHWAHEGISIEHGLTYSIGFRAPDYRQLARAFLEWLDDQINIEGRHVDSGMRPSSNPGQLPRQMIRDAIRLMDTLRWDGKSVRDFLGCYLSEPKIYSRFLPPGRPLSQQQFARKLASCTVTLSLPTCMLYFGREIFINGEQFRCDARSEALLARLANARTLVGTQVARHLPLIETIYVWYRAGYVALRHNSPSS